MSFTWRSIFQRSYEGASVQAELAVRVLEAAIAREREEFGPCEEPAKRSVERGIGEAIRGVADNDRFSLRSGQVREVFHKGRVDQEVRRKSPGQKPRPRGLSRREQLLVRDRDAHAFQAREK